MFEIIEKQINVDLPLDHHLHAMICQIPNYLDGSNVEQKWAQLKSILELIAAGEGNLKKCHFLIFPETSVPAEYVEQMLEFIAYRFRTNLITVFGVEHVPLAEYRNFLQRYSEDNTEVLASVIRDLDAGDIDEIPTNWCLTAVKENSGRLRVFAQAKSHPFVGEEQLDTQHDLYRGKVFPLFHCQPNCFNFMSLICLDYVYRDLYQSNINAIIEHANQLFFHSRQRLDLLLVIKCNPKPEHAAFRDVVNGFYGEYLAYTPGVRDTITVFCNTSAATSGVEFKPNWSFGHSAVIIHKSHKMAAVNNAEYRADDFDGLPVFRLRFGSETRLYYFNLPMFHELDPRTTRVPLKIHGIFQPAKNGWQRLEDSRQNGHNSDLHD
ncbi:hypothetical protein SAMN02745165_03064 [Malonomonas rubra DSM 5091]|uniref:Uncharacterized protein n=1 Tax=Malonomonas rubra DSM 5091 TaxID=1122189 RepID=A0A1M6LS05_MALRU|nr:hypothetical protein [Malonomonas rubra]SHJ73963.1 hypothetical protein SAMN02745165_03064 [Malonomonas rubra DSM 5091]